MRLCVVIDEFIIQICGCCEFLLPFRNFFRWPPRWTCFLIALTLFAPRKSHTADETLLASHYNRKDASPRAAKRTSKTKTTTIRIEKCLYFIGSFHADHLISPQSQLKQVIDR